MTREIANQKHQDAVKPKPQPQLKSILRNRNVRQMLKEGALANARVNLEIAQEWFPLEQEASDKLDQEQSAKTTLSAWKSIPRRKTQL